MIRKLLLPMVFCILSTVAHSQAEKCPTTDPQQNFCESEGKGNNFHRPRISDLRTTGGGNAPVMWYATSEATNALPPDHLLEDGEDYYAGSSSCSTRSRVVVTIDDAPNAGATTTANICSTDGPVDLLELYRPSILGPPDAGGVMSPALASGTTIFDPAVDAPGKYRYTVKSANGHCPSDDSFITINVVKGPNAGENGNATFSADDAPKDLMPFLGGTPDAGGTWSPSLGADGLFDPATEQPGIYTYTVKGGKYCTDAKSTVDVSIFVPCPVVSQEIQRFCESEGTGNNFYRPSVAHLQATPSEDGLKWYATATSTTPLPSTEILIDGEDYYAGNNSGTCTSRQKVIAQVDDAPNAGATTTAYICSTDGPVDLLDVYRPSILGPPDAGGTISPALASGTTIFDPTVDAAGKYKYTVKSTNGQCPSDDSTIFVNIVKGPNAGENGTAMLATNDTPKDLMSFLGGTPDLGGTWSPSLGADGLFDPATEQPGIYTYTVKGSTYCKDAMATVEVSTFVPCPVVTQAIQRFCESEGTGNNFYRPSVAHLQATPGADGLKWYATATSTTPLPLTEILIDGEDYFAGNNSGTCTSRPKVIAQVDDAPNAGATTTAYICSTDGPVDLLDVYRPSILGPPDAGGTIVPALASGTTVFDPTVDVAGKYRYVVKSTNGQCPSDDSTIFVNIVKGPNAGENGTAMLAANDSPKDLKAYLGGTPDAGGTWSPSLGADGLFDPATEQPGIYTYTVKGSKYCKDAKATVNVSIFAPCPVVTQTVQRFCESEGTGNNFYRPSVANLQATASEDGLQWYATATSTTPLSPSEFLVDGEDYFAGNNSGTCSNRERVQVTVDDAPNAGKTTRITVKSTDSAFDLLDRYEPSILGAPDAGGTISPALASGTTVFDPAVDKAGKYTYTVRSANGKCSDDSSSVTVVIEDNSTAQMNQITAYPNPVQRDLNLSPEQGVEMQSIRLMNLSGETLYQRSSLNTQDLQSLDMSSLKPSVYFIEITTNSGKTVKRIIKK